jgi:hypothetical protein
MESDPDNRRADSRHEFIIVIPVADRPRHLNNCLHSLINLCEQFHYGGYRDQRHQKIQLLIADDSRSEQNRARIEQTTQAYDRRGLKSHYFGPKQQLAQLDKLSPRDRTALLSVLGDHPRNAFYHKGASCTRNISYLKLKELVDQAPNTLIWFIDSDQEFRINSAANDQLVYGINYFHEIDRIFTTTGTRVLTGKVVGDPPVSPAVMGGNFLEDTIAFLSTIATLDLDHPCEFHARFAEDIEDAAYHDMAELFGYKSKQDHYTYNCNLPGEHSNKTCLANFAAQLSAFFDGQHPTRQTYYKHLPPDESLTAARTVYTGNYVLKADALSYFIPFATLDLRMAGPVLGRILKAELGEEFVSANLPLLHKRTLTDTCASEFRTGIEKRAAAIDLSIEFEKQFFGDVMLFTIQELTKQGYPATEPAAEVIEPTVNRIADEMLAKYRSKQMQIGLRLADLRILIQEPDYCWQREPEYTETLDHLNTFLHNMEHNFGKDSISYRMIEDYSHCQIRCREICQAIIQYPLDRNHWSKVMNR